MAIQVVSIGFTEVVDLVKSALKCGVSVRHLNKEAAAKTTIAFGEVLYGDQTLLVLAFTQFSEIAYTERKMVDQVLLTQDEEEFTRQTFPTVYLDVQMYHLIHGNFSREEATLLIEGIQDTLSLLSKLSENDEGEK